MIDVSAAAALASGIAIGGGSGGRHVQTPQMRRRARLAPRRAATPGRLAAGLSLVAATGFGAWVAADATQAPARVADPDQPLQLSEVARGDVTAALATMSHRGAIAQKIAEDDRTCPMHLAYVTLQRDPAAPGQGEAGARIISGGYISPLFALGPTPLRVAIPYPAPFSAGHGTISVVASGGAVVSLLPAWHVLPGGANSQAVSWTPGPDCDKPF